MTTSDIRWNDRDEHRISLFTGSFLNPFIRLGARTREHHCPSCDSIVYCRRHKMCGVCGQELPKDCLFSAAEAENVEGLLRLERQRHKAWLKKTTAL